MVTNLQVVLIAGNCLSDYQVLGNGSASIQLTHLSGRRASELCATLALTARYVKHEACSVTRLNTPGPLSISGPH